MGEGGSLCISATMFFHCSCVHWQSTREPMSLSISDTNLRKPICLIVSPRYSESYACLSARVLAIYFILLILSCVVCCSCFSARALSSVLTCSSVCPAMSTSNCSISFLRFCFCLMKTYKAFFRSTSASSCDNTWHLPIVFLKLAISFRL